MVLQTLRPCCVPGNLPQDTVNMNYFNPKEYIALQKLTMTCHDTNTDTVHAANFCLLICSGGCCRPQNHKALAAGTEDGI